MSEQASGMKKFGIGQPVRRVEDTRFITGAGRYTDDVVCDGALHMAVLRSPHAHARFSIVDTKRAKEMPGVEAVWTAEDVTSIKGIACESPLKTADGKTMQMPPWPVLQADTVRHIGDAVAIVIAKSLPEARDAAETIEIDYTPLPAVTSLAEAASAKAAGSSVAVWPHAPDHIAFDQTLGSLEKTEAAFARAAHIVPLTIENNRLVTNYMEPRACIAEYFANTDSYVLTLGSQGVHSIRDAVAEQLGIAEDAIHVVTPDVGGGFGTKSFNYREYALALAAAKALGKPVRWTQERTEHFLACAQGRDNLSTAELALDAKGKILALKLLIRGNLGAYLSTHGPYIPWLGATMATGPYDIPALFVRCQGFYTHTVPVDAYRGAGRPEAAYLLERLIDTAARTLSMDPARLRERNFVKPASMPYRTQTRRTYDVGDFAGHMRAALEAADRKGFPARLKTSKKNGKLRGFGFASYIECTAWGSGEDVSVTLGTDGVLTLTIGTQSNGQGHETAYAQAISQTLDVPMAAIRVLQGDTRTVRTGNGTGGSRSIPVGLVSTMRASETLAEKLKLLAADALEVSMSDLLLAEGAISVIGTDRRLTLQQIANLPQATLDKRSGQADFSPADATYPNGTHACEVEIDPETGHVALLSYTVVDDFGVTVNPLLLAGQVHGGIVQGLGQALLERTVYDKEGQLLSASLMDYALPRADHAVNFRFSTRNIPSTTNPLGIKGAGEAGSIGSCPAIMNAVVDALHRAHGILHIDMPATPERVWMEIARMQTQT